MPFYTLLYAFKFNEMGHIGEEELKVEIQHIFDSGANEIRIFEMIKIFLINPEIGMLVNEFGVEMPNSNIRNTIEVEKFILNLEMKYNQESN